MMVGLVSSLGLDLPTRCEVGCWYDSGRAWCEARLNDMFAGSFETAPAIGTDADVSLDAVDDLTVVTEAPARPAPEDADAEDRAFDEVVESIVTEFAAAPIPTPATTPTITATETDDDDYYPGLAYALNREADGLSLPAERAALAGIGPAPAAEPEEPAAPPAAPRVQRFANAMRLTGQALQAWAALLQTSAVLSVQN
jgi:hypothetical protein